jgi:hypothetical protein
MLMQSTTDSYHDILRLMKDRFHLIHLSNCFFRDFHYGVIEYYAGKGKKLGYGAAESMTRDLIRSLEVKGILKPIDQQTWLLNYPEFKIIPAAAPVAAPKTA